MLLLISIIICSVEMIYPQSTTKISGLIKDKTGEPLIGANVYIYKTIEGGITDNNGKLVIIVNKEFDDINKGKIDIMINEAKFKSSINFKKTMISYQKRVSTILPSML